MLNNSLEIFLFSAQNTFIVMKELHVKNKYNIQNLSCWGREKMKTSFKSISMLENKVCVSGSPPEMGSGIKFLVSKSADSSPIFFDTSEN